MFDLIDALVHKTHVAAELGINHNASLPIAKQLIDAAIFAGADSVKFQKRAVYESVPKAVWHLPKETPWGNMTYLQYKEMMEFSIEQFDELYCYARMRGMPLFWSVWDTTSYVAIKENFAPIMWKIPSACITNTELLTNIRDSLRRQNKFTPVVISTGGCTMEQVDCAMGILKPHGNVTICHCNSSYPCPPKDLNLRCIPALQRAYPWAKTGYSGHETGLATTLAAVVLGAQYVERHLTLDRSMWGTDQSSSVEPQGFKRMVDDIRTIEAALGDGVKRVTEAEQAIMKKLRG